MENGYKKVRAEFYLNTLNEKENEIYQFLSSFSSSRTRNIEIRQAILQYIKSKSQETHETAASDSNNQADKIKEIEDKLTRIELLLESESTLVKQNDAMDVVKPEIAAPAYKEISIEENPFSHTYVSSSDLQNDIPDSIDSNNDIPNDILDFVNQLGSNKI